MIPLSLYIHFPWCVRKCPYCDFNSHARTGILPEKTYIDTLLADFERDLPLIQGRAIHSIFMGGGTPSLFSAASLKILLSAISQRCDFEPNIEITLEANPGALERDQFHAYRAIGINRISLGVQSFNNQHLLKLGRIHQCDEIFQAVEGLKEAGFEQFNLDLMHGLPAQTLEQALDDLSQAIALNPPHLSWYQLTIEPNTIFHKKPPILPQEKVLEGIETEGILNLKNAGLSQYEVSAFSRPQMACQHNLNYWQFGDYLGIGAGAHAKITNLTSGVITRFSKKKQPNSYLAKKDTFIAEQQVISTLELPFEFMMNALRLNEGASLEAYSQRTGLAVESLLPWLDKAIDQRLLLLDREKKRIIPTELGRRFLNDVLLGWLVSP